MKMPFQYPFLYCQCNTRGIEVVVFAHLCKKEGKNQESIQSSTTGDHKEVPAGDHKASTNKRA